jgi:hypothetical protein
MFPKPQHTPARFSQLSGFHVAVSYFKHRMEAIRRAVIDVGTTVVVSSGKFYYLIEYLIEPVIA